jgi:hypothetical protein
MAYKTVRRNGRDVLINTATGKEVRPGERIGNELRYIGQGITDNFTYSDKVDARSGRRLTPKEVRNAEKPKASKPAAKPATKPAAKAKSKMQQEIDAELARRDNRLSHGGGHAATWESQDKIDAIRKKYGAVVADYKDAQGNVYDGRTGRLKSSAKPASKPATRTNDSDGNGRTYASASTRTTTASVTEPKPVPKPAGKVPASSETYRDGGKGLYQGSKEYRDKVGGSGNPLLNRFRQDMGRDASSGSKAEPKMSKPEDKSKYVASNGKPYMGPAFGSGKAEPAKPASPASPNKSEKGMTLAERMRRRRQSGMA